MFQVTTMNLYDLKKDENGSIIYDDDFFGKQASLTVSGQLEGELAATAMGAIYTFGPTFRAENSNTPRHLAEFWMVEPEVAFADLKELMDLEEEFIKYCVNWALENCQDDLAFLNKMVDKGLIERLQSVVKADFVRLPYTEGIKILEEAIATGRKFEFPVYWGCDLASEHERYLVEEHFQKPVIMIDQGYCSCGVDREVMNDILERCRANGGWCTPGVIITADEMRRMMEWPEGGCHD